MKSLSDRIMEHAGFVRETDASGKRIDHETAIVGRPRVVPPRREEGEPLYAMMEPCATIDERANALWTVEGDAPVNVLFPLRRTGNRACAVVGGPSSRGEVSRVETDARDCLDRRHVRRVRDRTCGPVMA